MKQFLILAAAIAAVTQFGSAAPCGSGTLSSYVGLGSSGCTVGGTTFSNFALLGGTTGGVEIGASSVLLSPVGGSFTPGLTTMFNLNSGANMVQETLFTFRVSGSMYTGASAALSNASETGDGAVTGLVNFCAGGSFGSDGISGCTGMAGGLATVDAAQNMDSSTFAKVNFLSVTNDLTIDGGTMGSAHGATLVNQFTATPEPLSFWLTAMALSLAVGVRLKYSNTNFGR